jgi:hypothetical protein
MILYSLYCFLELVILEQQLNVDAGLALFTFSLCLPLKVSLFFLKLLFIYI